jgi:hypothetical protein
MHDASPLCCAPAAAAATDTRGAAPHAALVRHAAALTQTQASIWDVDGTGMQQVPTADLDLALRKVRGCVWPLCACGCACRGHARAAQQHRSSDDVCVCVCVSTARWTGTNKRLMLDVLLHITHTRVSTHWTHVHMHTHPSTRLHTRVHTHTHTRTRQQKVVYTFGAVSVIVSALGLAWMLGAP